MFQIQADWVRNFPTVRMKFDCPIFQEISSFVGVSQIGSMNKKFFYKYFDKFFYNFFFQGGR